MNEQAHRTDIKRARRVYLRQQVSGRTRRAATQDTPNPENGVTREFAADPAISISSLITAGLVGLGLAAVEAVRIGLVHSALDGFLGDAGAQAQALPFAIVLTLGLAALDMGLLLRLFSPATVAARPGDTNRSMALWSAIGAWLVTTTANSILAMYAIAAMMDAEHQLADVAPAAVAIALLVLRLLLVGALAWDAGNVLGRSQ